MHKLLISKLGPIENCDINVNDFMVFTGPQASGKSTVAKAIFFFRTIKDDIVTILLKQYTTENRIVNLKNTFIKNLRNKFMQIFGTSWAMSLDMKMSYYYTSDVSITISLRQNTSDVNNNIIWIDTCYKIDSWLKEKEDYFLQTSDTNIKDVILNQLSTLFDDNYETVFIPAGRSLITLLTNQLNYIYTSMDENQRRTIDYCTQTYIERILKIKPHFEKGIMGMRADKILLTNEKFNIEIVETANKIINNVLKGKYFYSDGIDKLVLDNGKYVKINFASSGQQESVWIFNIIFYYLLENKRIYLILEEPESHLYPNAQKMMAELIGLVINNHSNALITTHSPYILGEFNNLIFAFNLYKYNHQEVNKIIDKNKLIDFNRTSAYFFNNERLEDCLDYEISLIRNEVIDGASDEINSENDELFKIQDIIMGD